MRRALKMPRTDSVANTLIDAVLHGDIEVVAHICETGDLDHIDDKITALQNVTTLGGGTNGPRFATAWQ